MSTTIMRPGILVSLHTSLRGGVHYHRVDLDKSSSEDTSMEKWETTKMIDDVAEYEAAVKVRGKVSNLIRGVCAHSTFGLLCATVDEGKLDAAIVESRQLAAEFNATHQTVQIGVYCLKGRIAETDQEATRAISSEIRELLEAMQKGIAGCDVKAVREAAVKARQLGQMLDPTVGEKVSKAIQEARLAAREIVRRISEGADKTEVAIEEVKLRNLNEARTAFLDMDAPAEVESLPIVARGIDMEVAEEMQPAVSVVEKRSIEEFGDEEDKSAAESMYFVVKNEIEV